jgi:hypothetical protein
MTKEIEEFILLNDTEDNKLFSNNAEKKMFIILSDQICMLFEEYNKERYFDKLKLIKDFYDKIFVFTVRPLMENNEKLMKELELQMKYGMRITLLPEQIDKIMGEL